MSEQNIAIVQRYHEELRKDNLSIIEELISPNFISHSKYKSSNREQIKRDEAGSILSLKAIELEYKYSAKDDWVYVHTYLVFKLIQPDYGAIPDGKIHALNSIDAWRVQNGLITEFKDISVERLY
jgi:hypothetical protein